MIILPPLRVTLSLAAFCLIAAPTPILAQSSPTTQIIGCQSIDNDIARLACFDQIAARLNTGTPTPRPQISTPALPKFSEKAAMAPLPSIAPSPAQTPLYAAPSPAKSTPEPKAVIKDFGKDMSQGPKPKEAALLTPKGDVVFTVKHVQIFDHIKKRFYMTNGQVWEQITAANLDIDEGKPPAGTTAEISKSGFGGYKLKINDKKWGVKVKRVR